MTAEIYPFRTSSNDAVSPSDQSKSNGDNVLWVFSERPVPSKPWLSPHAQSLRARREKNAPPVVTPITQRTLAEVIQEAAARPQVPLRDVSEDIKALPPIDRVERTLAALVPENGHLRPWASDFLEARSRLEGNESRFQKARIQNLWEEDAQYIEDAENLSPTELKDRYQTTYSSWKNMKSRRKTVGAVIHPRFEKFADFLVEVGPRPGEEYTLDRIDPSDPEYAPGKVRWLDKEGQANNREITITVDYLGETKPISVWARETGQEADTLRARHRKGWSDSEVITGHRGEPKVPDQRPWNAHTDTKQKEIAEMFYLKNRFPNEAPFEFCLRYIHAGIDPWENFLRENDDPCADDCFSGFAPHCVPELQKAKKVVLKLEPTREWLNKTWEALKVSAEPTFPIPDEPSDEAW